MKRYATDSLGRFAGQIPRAPGPLPHQWQEPVAHWRLSLHDAGKAPASIDGYARHVAWLAHDLSNVAPEPWQMTPALLTAWLDAQNWSAVTRRKVVGSLRNFYTWAMVEGLCQRSPLAGVASVPPRRRGPNRLNVPAGWAAPVDQWVAWMEAAALTPGTIEQSLWWIRRLSETFSDPWSVTPDDLALFLSRTDWAPETKRRGRSTVRTFYRWAERVGHVETSPARDLPAVRIPRAYPRPAPDDALAIALAKADDRTRLILALATYAGLRRAEVAQVHARDIGLDTLRVLGKGGNERIVPLHPDLAAMLTREIRQRREGKRGTGWTCTPAADGWLFPSDDPSQHLTPAHVGKLIVRVMPPGWTAHTLRHRFATQAYAVERDLRAVQELLGHASPTTTIRYAAVPTDALRAAVGGVALPAHVERG